MDEEHDDTHHRALSVAAALAIAVAATGVLLASPVFGPELTGIVPALARELVSDLSSAPAMAAAAFGHSPVFVVAVAAAFLLPAIGAAIRLGYTARRCWAERQGGMPAEPRLPEADCPWPSEGYLAVDQPEAAPVKIGEGLIRIGRQDDNDIRLADRAAHRYHAIAYRTYDAHFFIADVSGDVANLMRVNGAHLTKARLANGDKIEIGGERLTFKARPL